VLVFQERREKTGVSVRVRVVGRRRGKWCCRKEERREKEG
jgi:hypothetical protein